MHVDGELQSDAGKILRQSVVNCEQFAFAHLTQQNNEPSSRAI
jgi:hypothetical protein